LHERFDRTGINKYNKEREFDKEFILSREQTVALRRTRFL